MSEQELQLLKDIVGELVAQGRYDLLMQSIGVPALQRLNIEAAKARLSELVITHDFRFFLPAYGKEVEMEPIHKTLYLFFLNQTEGIELKRLIDYRNELLDIYNLICRRTKKIAKEESIDRLVNPLDNSIHEKCARIKKAFSLCMDEYQLSYYAISAHTVRHVGNSSKVWFERKKSVTLPRQLVKSEIQEDTP